MFVHLVVASGFRLWAVWLGLADLLYNAYLGEVCQGYAAFQQTPPSQEFGWEADHWRTLHSQGMQFNNLGSPHMFRCWYAVLFLQSVLFPVSFWLCNFSRNPKPITRRPEPPEFA